jgi:CubicO group peptidase (beta-lactamase class C family)
VERISGSSFHTFLRTRLLDPIGMADSTFRLADTKLPRFAYPYRPDGNDATRMTRIAPFTWAGYPDGSLRTTVDDYGRFLAMLMNTGRSGGTPEFRADTIATWLAPQKISNLPPARGPGIG